MGERYRYLGLAKLVAGHFIPNPKKFEHVIFKDRNNHNCHADNIAWVDGETFIYYSGIIGGAQKIVLTREEALKECTDVYLRGYYETLDESWLDDCWIEIERRLKDVYAWDACRSECYLYFLDRAHRYSIVKDPAGMLFLYMKSVKAKIRQEISHDMPNSVVWKNDESLRTINYTRSYRG